MLEVDEWSKIKVIGRGQIILNAIVNFKLKLAWAMIHRYMVKHYSGAFYRMFLDKSNIEVGEL